MLGQDKFVFLSFFMKYCAAWGKMGIDFGLTYSAENITLSKLNKNKYFLKDMFYMTLHWTERKKIGRKRDAQDYEEKVQKNYKEASTEIIKYPKIMLLLK